MPKSSISKTGLTMGLATGLGVSLALALFGATPALADPIEGKWRTQAGEMALISPCSKGFCIDVKTGTYKGRQIGHVQPKTPGKYEGKVTDPANDTTYSGKITISGTNMQMEGCFLFICDTQHWTRY